MVRAYPVMQGLRQLTRVELPKEYICYKFDEHKLMHENVKRYTTDHAIKKHVLAYIDTNSFSFDNDTKYTPVFNHKYVMAQIRQDFHTPKQRKPAPFRPPIKSSSGSGKSSSSQDSDDDQTDPDAISTNADLRSEVSGSPKSFFFLWRKPKSIQDAMKALDSFSLFIDTDKENYCLVNNAIPVVMKQTEKWIEKERNGSFGSFQKSIKYVSENAKSSRMIPFWKNLYYQFGLIHISLDGNLRPSRVPQHLHLLECCETICRVAQWQLYENFANWNVSYQEDLDMYQSTYNKTHGTLRWFEDDNENYLHVSIHRLNPILTIWMMDDKSHHKVERRILKRVFEIKNCDYDEAVLVTSQLKDKKDSDYLVYSQFLHGILEWNWNVTTGEEWVYNKIYDESKKICDENGITPKMMYIEAVEHHRRYDTQVGPSVFWSSGR